MKSQLNNKKNSRAVITAAIVLISAFGVAAIISPSVFANVGAGFGGVSQPDSSQSGDGYKVKGDSSNCWFGNDGGIASWQARRCPHYIKSDIATFKKAVARAKAAGRNYYKEALDETNPESAYNVCTNPDINTSGTVVWVGMDGLYDSNNNWSNSGTPDYFLLNITNQLGFGKYKAISSFPSGLSGGSIDLGYGPKQINPSNYYITPNLSGMVGNSSIYHVVVELRGAAGHDKEHDFWSEEVPNWNPGWLSSLNTGGAPANNYFVLLQTILDVENQPNDYNLAFFCAGMLGDAGGSFTSNSNVRIGEEASNYKSSGWTDNATAELKGEAESGSKVNITFSHDMIYSGTIPEEGDNYVPSTEWTYTLESSGGAKSVNSLGDIYNDRGEVVWPSPTTYTYTPTDNKAKKVILSHSYEVELPEVETGTQIVTVCETISYNPKQFRDEEAVYSNPATYSKACAVIVVSSNPSGEGDVPPESCPIPGYEGTVNYGNTVAQSGVRNSSKDTTWTTTSSTQDTAFVWAKPGDSVQFKHTLCYGAQAVRGSGSGGGDRNILPDKANTATIKAYTIQATNGTNYLFGKTLSGKTSQSFNLAIGEPQPEAISSADDVGDYFFTYYSPSIGQSDGNGGRTNNAGSDYSCSDEVKAKINHYQIIGYESTSLMPSNCNSKNKVNAVSDVGKIIEQDLEWNEVKAYVNEHETASGGSCGCNENSAYANNAGNDYDGAKTAAASSKIGHHVRYCTSGSPCGCCGEYCRKCHTEYNLTDYWYYPISTTSKQGTTQKAQVKVPYNYETELELTTSQSRLYGGGEFGVSIQININPRENSDISDTPYATISKTSEYKIAAFIVSPSASVDSVPGENDKSTNSDICSYYNGGRNCEVVKAVSGEQFNGEGNLGGASESLQSSGDTVTVPDLEVGTKFCIAVGVYPSDSHDYTSGPAGDGDIALNDSGKYWHYSEPVCRTITKKPTVEFHTNGIFSYGNITTSQTKKMVGYSLGSYGDLYGSDILSGKRNVFGSWSEYEIMTKGSNLIGSENGMASGAAFGGTGYPNVGLNQNVNPCTISTQSFTNSECSSSSIGNLSTSAFDSVIMERLISRYTKDEAPNESITSINLSVGTCVASGSTYSPSNPDAGYTCLDNGTKYYRVRNANVYGDVYGVNGESNTVVVDASGTITISGNIAYKSITGGDNFSNLADLPQLLIFAEGINIVGSVTRVDAWLLAGQKSDSASTAYVNTCSDVSNDHFMFNSDQGASVCNLQLEINGPIFAKNLYLNRTAGAGTGVNSGEPGETIRLRSDTYLWAYNQAQRFSQAVTTYSRELAPRY